MKNKKGISLIVLVITIIVIIILAAAVILTLTNNNPINNAKVASMAQSKDSVESAINLYTAQVIAKTQGEFDNQQIILGGAGTSAIANTATKISISVGDPAVVTDYYPIIPGAFETEVGLKLPTSQPTGAIWCITPASNKVYLVFPTAVTVPTWISSALGTDTALQSFVIDQ